MTINDSMLSLNELKKNFGGVTAVNNIDIDVKNGEIFGIIGPNGAGKTTIFNLITGIYPPSEGKIIFSDEDITSIPTHIISQKGISRTFQNIRLFENLTVYNNILIACHHQAKYSILSGALRTKSCKMQELELAAEAEKALRSVGLFDKKDFIAGKLPYGEQRKIELARAIATKPKVLLLDEPAAGMNENESKELIELIRQIKDEYNLTIIIIDHHMDVIMSLCDKIAVLNFGQKIAMGTPMEIQNNEAVVEAYLGVDE